MSDLISRSELIKFFKEHMRTAKDFREIIINIIPTIENQPTAYDVDKVVEELKEELSLANKEKERCIGENHLQFDSAKGYASGISIAIEIVKQGGDVCEWELKNVCYTTSIKHYYSLPTSIVKTFNNCPYCGKKIKIVGD